MFWLRFFKASRHFKKLILKGGVMSDIKVSKREFRALVYELVKTKKIEDKREFAYLFHLANKLPTAKVLSR